MEGGFPRKEFSEERRVILVLAGRKAVKRGKLWKEGSKRARREGSRKEGGNRMKDGLKRDSCPRGRFPCRKRKVPM